MSKEKLNMDFINDEQFDPIYEAVCQAVDESVVNAMLAAETMTTVKPFGKTVQAIDKSQLVNVMEKYNRM
nr:P1 family peptidase [Siminovitchia fortis]